MLVNYWKKLNKKNDTLYVAKLVINDMPISFVRAGLWSRPFALI